MLLDRFNDHLREWDAAALNADHHKPLGPLLLNDLVGDTGEGSADLFRVHDHACHLGLLSPAGRSLPTTSRVPPNASRGLGEGSAEFRRRLLWSDRHHRDA